MRGRDHRVELAPGLGEAIGRQSAFGHRGGERVADNRLAALEEALEAAGVRIEAFQVTHFGWRFPWEKDRSKGYHEGRSYNSYLLTRNGRSVFFVSSV